MLDYLTPKRYRSTKKKGVTAASPGKSTSSLEPLLSPHDEKFLASIINKAGVPPAGKLEVVNAPSAGGDEEEEEQHVIFSGGRGVSDDSAPDSGTYVVALPIHYEELEQELMKLAIAEDTEGEDEEEQKEKELEESAGIKEENKDKGREQKKEKEKDKEKEKEKEGTEENEEESESKSVKDGKYEEFMEEIKDKWGHFSNISEAKLSQWQGQVQGQLKRLNTMKFKARFRRRKNKEIENGNVKDDKKGNEKSTPEEEIHDPNETVMELSKENRELGNILESLNLAASRGKILSSSSDLKTIHRQFAQILKDLASGVPTAYSDLANFLEKSSSTLQTQFASLPSFLQRVVKQLPESAMKTEVLRTVVAASPALTELSGATSASMLFKQIALKPAIITELLKDAVVVLKTRFPLLLGGSVAVTLAVSVLMFLLWYCWKRGKEERELEEENRRLEEFGVEKIPTEKEFSKREKEEREERIRREGDEELGGYHSPRSTPAMETPTEAPAEKLSETLTKTLSEKPVETPTDTPTEGPTEAPTKNSMEKPTKALPHEGVRVGGPIG